MNENLYLTSNKYKVNFDLINILDSVIMYVRYKGILGNVAA